MRPCRYVHVEIVASDSQNGPSDDRCKAIKDSNPGGAVDADFKRNEALRLKRAGLTYEAIADELGCAKSTAFKWVNDGWAALKSENDDERCILRAIEESKLDAMEKVLVPIVTANNLLVKKVIGSQDGDEVVYEDGREIQLKSIDRWLKILKRRAELRGLDSPKKLEITKGKSSILPLSELRQRVRPILHKRMPESANPVRPVIVN